MIKLKLNNVVVDIPDDDVYLEVLLRQHGIIRDNDSEVYVKSVIDGKSWISTLEEFYSFFINLLKDTVSLESSDIVLDVGSGVGIIDIGIAKEYTSKNLQFILVDGNEGYIKGKNSKNYSENYQPYGSWTAITQSITANNLDISNFKIIDPKNKPWAEPNSVGVVMSRASWGWHYPIETYLDDAFNMLKPGGYLLISPILNVDNPIDKINGKFGKPKRLDTVPLFVNRAEEAGGFKNAVGNTDTMFRGIWQKGS